MIATELTLGGALAILKYTISEGPLPVGNSEENGQLLRLRQRYQAFVADVSSAVPVVEAIPKTACQGDPCLLAGNEDFYIVHLLGCLPDPASGNYCFRLARHLNSCYSCFQEYSHVLRDYCLQLQNLSKSGKTS
ncbi:MAG: hypothetical protein ACE5IY_17210 [bacterium]